MSPSGPGTLDAIADRLYGLHPDAFVPARDDAVAEARQAGDRDLARAIGRLRRPTRAAWLANLLARERPDQLDGLLALAGDLASAQRTLDGGALRALSAQRNRLVAAMAREGGRLAAQAGDSATESVVRDLAGILEAALADPAVADEVRSGRLTRTVSYSGFGPGPGSAGGRDTNGTAPAAADSGRARAGQAGEGRGGGGQDGPDAKSSERERAERERIERERAERERAVAEAERVADAARDRQESAEADRADADAAHEAAKAQVADLSVELEAARERERTAAATARAATASARDAAREAATAAARADRARGRLAELAPD